MTCFQSFLDHCQQTENASVCRRTDWINCVCHMFLNQSDCIPAEAKLRYITEQHSVNHSFCDSLPSTVQTRDVFNDVGRQICLNGTGWCNMLKDCVVACRTGSQGQWNCKPFSYWKGLSSWINKVTGEQQWKSALFFTTVTWNFTCALSTIELYQSKQCIRMLFEQ